MNGVIVCRCFLLCAAFQKNREYAVLALCCLILVLLCHICYYVCIPFSLYFLIRLILSFRKQKPDVLDMITLTAILFFTVMLIHEGMATGSDSSVNHFGITPLALLVCIMLLAIVNNEKINRQTILLQEEILKTL